MTGSFWADLAITIVTGVLSALGARYGIKLPPVPTPPKPDDKKTDPMTPGKE
jgi:hypothetical protein